MDMDLCKLREMVRDREASWTAVHAVSKSQVWFGNFPTKGLNPHLLHPLHWQTGSLPLVPPGKPNSSTLHLNYQCQRSCDRRQSSGGERKWWGAAVNTDEASLASPPPTSCYYSLVPDRPQTKNRPWPGDRGTLPYGNAGIWSRLPPSCRPGNFRLNYLKFYSWERLKLRLADIKSWLGLAHVTPFGAACFLLTSIMKEQRRKWD